jgi:hypothetical protein
MTMPKNWLGLFARGQIQGHVSANACNKKPAGQNGGFFVGALLISA